MTLLYSDISKQAAHYETSLHTHLWITNVSNNIAHSMMLVGLAAIKCHFPHRLMTMQHQVCTCWAMHDYCMARESDTFSKR